MTAIELELTRLAGVPVAMIAIRGAYVVAPVDRALLTSPVWSALRAGPRDGVGRTPLEAALLLARAIGSASPQASRRTRAAVRSADLWLIKYLRRAQGTASAREVSVAAERDGVTRSSLRMAAERLRVIKTKSGLRAGWIWRLPAEDDTHLRTGADVRLDNF